MAARSDGLDEQLRNARERVVDAQRRLLELALLQVYLNRLGDAAGLAESRFADLERALGELRADLEFAEQRVRFRRRGARASAPAQGGAVIRLFRREASAAPAAG